MCSLSLMVGYPRGWKKVGQNGRVDKPKGTPKAAYVDTNSSPVPGLTQEQFSNLEQYFSSSGEVPKLPESPNINMIGKNAFIKPKLIDSGATKHITCDGKVLERSKNHVLENPV